MARPIPAATLLVLLLAACGSYSGTVATDLNRTVLGVGADEPRPADNTVLPATDRVLAWKESQLCTRGATPVQETVEPGQNARAFADRQLRCNPYDFSVGWVDFAHVSSDVSHASGDVGDYLKSVGDVYVDVGRSILSYMPF